MRLVRPSLGECADRMTILELKVKFGKLRGIPVAHFEEEHIAIKQYVSGGNLNDFHDEYEALQKVNLSLWNLERDVRHTEEWKKDPLLAVGILQCITELNDERAELVNTIDGAPAKEKLY